MTAARWTIVALAVLPAAASAQTMAGMPGMAAPAPARPPASAAAGRTDPREVGPPRADEAVASVPAVPGAPTGQASPPPVPTDFYADRTSPADAMAKARAVMMRDQGGQTFHQLFFNLAEVRVGDGHDGYRWDGEGWLGGDIDRLVVRSEGSGRFRGGADAAEVQLLYSHAIGPYFDLQGGLRHDFAPTPTRTYTSIGVEGLAPYQFQVEARAFVATTGQVLGRLEAWYDQRITQRLVLQPRAELNLAAQDDAPTRTGAGLSEAETGVRLRYEIDRQFAPYIGVTWRTRTGRTAAYARADGERPGTTAFVAGARCWF